MSKYSNIEFDIEASAMDGEEGNQGWMAMHPDVMQELVDTISSYEALIRYHNRDPKELIPEHVLELREGLETELKDQRQYYKDNYADDEDEDDDDGSPF